MIYLNNAKTTIDKPEGVKNAAPKTAAETKAKLAQFFKIKNPENIIFTKDEIQAMSLALRSLLKPGDHVISTVSEQEEVLRILEDLKAQGVEVTYIGVNPYGELKYDDIESEIKDNTKALVICHGSHVTGNVTDMERVTTIGRRHKLLVISDGSQTAGAIEVNLENLGIDVYCFSGHRKLLGPYGIGGLCLKDGVCLEKELVDELVDEAEKANQITPTIYGGLWAGLDFIMEKGIYGISIFPHRLAKRFFESVQSMDKVTVYGDFGTGIRIPTVAIKIAGFTPKQVKDHMRKNGIVIDGGIMSAPLLHEALGTAEEGLCRFSFGYFNDRREVNDTIWCLMDLLGLEDLYLLA